MNKEEFKNYVNEIAINELRNSFDNNLMETLNSAFIFKYVETLEKENKELKEQNETIQEKFKESKKYLSYTQQIEQLQQENKKYKDLQNRIDKALDFIDCHFKEMVADEEAQKLKSILKEVK